MSLHKVAVSWLVPTSKIRCYDKLQKVVARTRMAGIPRFTIKTQSVIHFELKQVKEILLARHTAIRHSVHFKMCNENTNCIKSQGGLVAYSKPWIKGVFFIEEGEPLKGKMQDWYMEYDYFIY